MLSEHYESILKDMITKSNLGEKLFLGCACEKDGFDHDVVDAMERTVKSMIDKGYKSSIVIVDDMNPNESNIGVEILL